MDERGLTRSAGHKDGRTITVPGLEELRNSLVTDKIGFVGSKIERLAYQTNVGLRSGTGRVPIDVCVFAKENYPRVLKSNEKYFHSGFCSSNMVAVAIEGTQLAGLPSPAGKSDLPRYAMWLSTVAC